jgi:ribonucleoside-triphosphate reductase
LTDTSWSNLASVVYKRTYSRPIDNRLETWSETCERAILGNVRLGSHIGTALEREREVERLRFFMKSRKAGPAGRGYWYSGTEAHLRFGGVALNNCWFESSQDWKNFVIAQDLLMLGGGVGMSVEHRFTSKLPRVKRGVTITHQPTKDADFIVPDSREGWCKLLHKTLEAFFLTGKGFTYSTICIRDYGTPIKGFGGTAAGARPLVELVEKLSSLLHSREGKHIHPIDAADILCAIAEMVVAGNVRRSAIIIIGDCFDKEFLVAKRWDLGPIPTQRAMANFSVACDDVDDLHPLYWKTYEQGEAFGIINRKNIQRFARMGELKKDTALGVNPCGEATLEEHEPCNLQDIALPNLSGVEEFIEAAVLMHRWGKRVTLEKYHHPEVDEVIKRNRRVGTSITGCLQSPLFVPEVLDRAYAAIQAENASYSKALEIPVSIRTTTIKPSGTMSKVYDVDGEGIHPGFSRHYIQRIRFGANDPAIPKLRVAGHHIEPVVKFDGGFDSKTLVVDFYREVPSNCPTVDEGYDTWKQLDAVLMAQKHWADQSVSVTVYYRRDDISRVKEWLSENLSKVKTISFLCHNDHGFKQAPKEAITKEQYEKFSARIKPVQLDEVAETGEVLDGVECAGGSCPVR